MFKTFVHTICETHNQTVLAGPGSLLAEYECVICIAIQDGDLPGPAPTDPEELFISKITSHDGGNCCCGSCEPDYCYGCSHYSQFCACFRVEILSPNFCAGQYNHTCGCETSLTEPPF